MWPAGAWSIQMSVLGRGRRGLLVQAGVEVLVWNGDCALEMRMSPPRTQQAHFYNLES